MAKICPITYMSITKNQRYSAQGLKLLSNKLCSLSILELSAKQQREEALHRANKMSIQGVQAKLSARLNIKDSKFEICDRGGNYILKPQSEYYPELPENEDLTMRLAKCIGIEVPVHGLIYSIDDSLTYFIKRFDRVGKGQKIAVEDFAQLSGQNRDTKYRYSMEKIINIIDQFCTFPIVEKKKLFTRVVFNYLIGNEDMHLKNYSLITKNNRVELSPAYDFLNSTIAIKNPKEEIALSLHGKKNNLTKKDLIDYYGSEKLGLNNKIIDEVLQIIKKSLPEWVEVIEISFLSDYYKNKYLQIIENRTNKVL